MNQENETLAGNGRSVETQQAQAKLQHCVTRLNRAAELVGDERFQTAAVLKEDLQLVLARLASAEDNAFRMSEAYRLARCELDELTPKLAETEHDLQRALSSFASSYLHLSFVMSEVRRLFGSARSAGKSGHQKLVTTAALEALLRRYEDATKLFEAQAQERQVREKMLAARAAGQRVAVAQVVDAPPAPASV